MYKWPRRSAKSKQNKTFQPQPIGLFQVLSKLYNYAEEIVFVTSHVRVIVLTGFYYKKLFDFV